MTCGVFLTACESEERTEEVVQPSELEKILKEIDVDIQYYIEDPVLEKVKTVKGLSKSQNDGFHDLLEYVDHRFPDWDGSHILVVDPHWEGASFHHHPFNYESIFVSRRSLDILSKIGVRRGEAIILCKSIDQGANDLVPEIADLKLPPLLEGIPAIYLGGHRKFFDGFVGYWMLEPSGEDPIFESVLNRYFQDTRHGHEGWYGRETTEHGFPLREASALPTRYRGKNLVTLVRWAHLIHTQINQSITIDESRDGTVFCMLRKEG